MNEGETVEMVTVVVQATTQVKAAVETEKVAVIPMVEEVMMVEVAPHLTKFGSPFLVRMCCDVFYRC